jgi:type II secretory pathway component PulC
MKPNKHILRLLVIVLLIVWSLVVYEIISAIYFGGNEEPSNTDNFIKDKNKSAEQFQYNENIRDPFRYYALKTDTLKRGNTPKPIAPIWNPPPFHLKGIIDAKSGKMVILEDGSGETFFLQRGDTLHGVRILAIESNRVQYEFEKKKSDWRL